MKELTNVKHVSGGIVEGGCILIPGMPIKTRN